MRVRIKFTKQGPVRYVGHLDMMRYFQKALRRADFDVALSGGFSPHMIMSFASPLGLGIASRGEYFDVDLHSATTSADMVKRLNEVMVEGVSVEGIRQVAEDKKDKAMTLVGAADYLLTVKDQIFFEGLEEEFKDFLSRKEIMVVKKTKKSESLVDIRPLIHDFSCPQRNVIYLRLSGGSENNLKPNLVLQAFYDYAGRELPPFSYYVERLDILTKDFVSLGEIGEIIE